MLDLSEDELRIHLTELQQEHADLDAMIDRIVQEPPYNELQIMRHKKRKLQLKDEIARVKSLITPDIIA